MLMICSCFFISRADLPYQSFKDGTWYTADPKLYLLVMLFCLIAHCHPSHSTLIMVITRDYTSGLRKPCICFPCTQSPSMCAQGPTDSCTGQDKSQAVSDTYFWAIFQITVGVFKSKERHSVEHKQVACYAKDQTCLVPCLRGYILKFQSWMDTWEYGLSTKGTGLVTVT